MTFEIRPVCLEKEYEIFVKWWKAHGWNPIPRAILSDFGYVVCDKDTGRMLAAGWAYIDKYKPLAFIEWVVADPENSPRESLKSLKMLIDAMTQTFKKSGKLVVMSSTKVDGLIKLFKKAGYSETASGLTHLAQVFNLKQED